MQRMREMQKCNLYGMLMICKRETGHGIGKNLRKMQLTGTEPELSHLVNKTEAMTNRPSAVLGS